MARFNAERHLRLMRRWAKVVDGSLSLVEAIRSGDSGLTKDRVAKVEEAARVLCETLGYMLVSDREFRSTDPGKPS